MSNTLFKIGDKVRRRKEFQDCLWSSGSNTLTVSESRRGEIQVKEFNEYWWTADRFELVTAAEPDFITQLRTAKSYVGKKVFYTGQKPFIVDKVSVVNETDNMSLSGIVNDYIRKNEFCVMVQGVRIGETSRVYFPVTAVQLAPEFTEIDLVVGRTAKIYDNKVVIAHLEFTHDEIKKLAKLL